MSQRNILIKLFSFLQGIPTVLFKDLQPGDKAKVIAYKQGNSAYNRQLMSLGLVPGTVFEVKKLAPLGDPVEIAFRGFRLSVRKHEAEVLTVEIV